MKKLLRDNEQRNILHEIIKRKANWIGHILRRNCLLKQVTEGKIKGQIEVTRRQGRRRKKLLDELNPSAWGHLNPSSYCDVGRLFYGVFKLWSKLQRKKLRNNF